jgi:lipopolysaccharide export system protein LptC
MSELADTERTRRQIAAAPGGFRDRLVRVLRVVLPSIIGVLIAILVVSPFAGTQELSFLLAKDAVNMATERMRLTDALYRGEDSKGRPFSIHAGSAVQKSSAEPILRMTDLSAHILMPEGAASLIAGYGQYDLDKETMRVTGPLSFDSGQGYNLVASNVELSMKTRSLRSFGPVSGRTRVGPFSANSLRADLNARTVTLSGGAHLRIEQNAIK